MIRFSWSNFFDASRVAGLLAFVWQIADKATSFYGRPRLRLLPFDHQRDVGIWSDPQPNVPRRKFFTLQVRNTGSRAAVRCVATLQVHSLPPGVRIADPRFSLHWASSAVTNQTSGANPIDIGAEGNRLDVAFTQEGQEIPGAWAGTPLALSVLALHQSYLPPGQYEAVIKVQCDNGAGDELQVRIHSPTSWMDLDASAIP